MTTIYFPDVSHYQQGLSLTGAVACIAKATEGTTFVDSAYVGFKAQAGKLGIPFAAYHWIHAGDVPGQARHAFSVVGAGVPLMIDDEDTHDGLSVARTLAFVNAYRALGGTVTLEYLPHWFWAQHGSPDLRPLVNAGLSLVSSNYSGYSDTGAGWAPYGGMTPAIWQYTASQVFNGYKCDFNAFKGTVEQLRALFTGGSQVTKPEVDMAQPRFFLLKQSAADSGSACITGGGPTLGWRTIATWATVQALAAEWGLSVDIKTWPQHTTAEANDLYGKPAAEHTGGGLTYDDAVKAAEEGANRAEDS